MKPKTVSVDELELKTRKVVALARRNPVLVCAPGQPTLVLRRVVDDDLADELVCQHPSVRASVRQARKDCAEGRGISLAETRRKLGL